MVSARRAAGYLMSSPLLDTAVREDWLRVSEQARTRRVRLWILLQSTVVVAALSLLLLRSFTSGWQGLGLPPELLLVPLFWILPLAAVAAERPRSLEVLLALAAKVLLILGMVILAYLCYPLRQLDSGSLMDLRVPAPLMLVLPLVMWSVLAWTAHRSPVQARQLGLTSREWPANLLLGLAAGAALGFHFLLTASSVPGLLRTQTPSPALLVWSVGYLLGLRVLGEELLFRGLGYHLVMAGYLGKAVPRLLRLILISSVIYWIPSTAAGPLGQLWLAAYGLVLATIATWLRHCQQTLLPGVVATSVFQLFLVTLSL